MAENLNAFPSLSDRVLKRCRDSDDPIVHGTPERIANLLQLASVLPDRYGWRLSPLESIRAQVAAAETTNAINQIYWKDQLGNAEAYSYTTVIRASELLSPAIRSLNLEELLAPAIIGRSMLELAVSFMTNATSIHSVSERIEFSGDTVVTSKDLEEAVVRAIWGTRLGEPESHAKQRNILTLLQRVSKHPQGKQVMPTYEYLCEIAHPNVVGNTRFWSRVEDEQADGSYRVVVEKRPTLNDHQAEAVEKICWSLGWASEVIKNSFMANQQAIGSIYAKLQNMH